jgi:hypothetical protein
LTGAAPGAEGCGPAGKRRIWVDGREMAYVEAGLA